MLSPPLWSPLGKGDGSSLALWGPEPIDRCEKGFSHSEVPPCKGGRLVACALGPRPIDRCEKGFSHQRSKGGLAFGAQIRSIGARKDSRTSEARGTCVWGSDPIDRCEKGFSHQRSPPTATEPWHTADERGRTRMRELSDQRRMRRCSRDGRGATTSLRISRTARRCRASRRRDGRWRRESSETPCAAVEHDRRAGRKLGGERRAMMDRVVPHIVKVFTDSIAKISGGARAVSSCSSRAAVCQAFSPSCILP